jgi:hypothetical protein
MASFVGQEVPAGYAAFTPTPAQSRAGMFGSGIYRTWDYTFDTWSASAGANFRLTDRSAVYGRLSRGSRMPTPPQWTFQTTDGSQITGETKKGDVETTMQGELGLKTSAERWSLLLTGSTARARECSSPSTAGSPTVVSRSSQSAPTRERSGAEVEGVVSATSRTPAPWHRHGAGPAVHALPLRFLRARQRPDERSADTRLRRQSPQRHRILLGTSAGRTCGATAELFADYRYSGDRPANRPNTVTIPGLRRDERRVPLPSSTCERSRCRRSTC